MDETAGLDFGMRNMTALCKARKILVEWNVKMERKYKAIVIFEERNLISFHLWHQGDPCRRKLEPTFMAPESLRILANPWQCSDHRPQRSHSRV
jgi:hypothetical protein